MIYNKLNDENITKEMVLYTLIDEMAKLENNGRTIESLYYYSNKTNQRGEEVAYTAKGIDSCTEKFYMDIQDYSIKVASIGVHYTFRRPTTGMEVKASLDLVVWNNC